ncbi:hypothetical protein QJQ45_027532, partial [Haematococcus lacustris]
MNWWPEAFPCRAAYAAVGLATRDYFPGKHGVLFLTKNKDGFVVVEKVGEDACHGPYLIVFGHASVLKGSVLVACQRAGLAPLAHRDCVPMKWSTTCVMCLLFCRCWQCGALQQPGGYPQVDHHQPEQPQFDYEAELALVAQFQEQFHELDQALTALQPHPDPPAQPARTPLRLFNRFALLDLESGVQKEHE